MYGIDKHIQFNHHVDTADYSSTSKTWNFDVTVNKKEKKTIRSKFYLVRSAWVTLSRD